MCTDAFMDLDAPKDNNGKTHMSDQYRAKCREMTVEREFMILCHTHPAANKISSSSTMEVYESSVVDHGARLGLREYGLNISNGDLLLLIGQKMLQARGNDSCYFLIGISLPNGEFDVLDISRKAGTKDEYFLAGFNKVLRGANGKMLPISNFWNAESRKNTK